MSKKASIGCAKQTKNTFDELKEELNEGEAYHVTSDMVMEELFNAYEHFNEMMDIMGEDKVKEVLQDKAKEKENHDNTKDKAKEKVDSNEGDRTQTASE